MLSRARPKDTKAPAVKATQHGSELAAECAQHVGVQSAPSHAQGRDRHGGLERKRLEYAAIRFDALKHARCALLARSAKPFCQNVAKRSGVHFRLFCQGYLALALLLGVEAQLDMLLARETANTLLAGALMDFERLHVAVKKGHQTSAARVRA